MRAFYNSILWEKIMSMETFKNRPTLIIDKDATVNLSFDELVYPGVDMNDADQVRMFAIHRLFDFQEALKIAEDQIYHMQREHPFIPEDFGFEALKIDGFKCYEHFSNKAILTPSIEPMKWLFAWGNKVMKINQEVYFPNNTVAYHFLVACGLFEVKPDEALPIEEILNGEKAEPFEFVAGIDPIEENGTVSQGNIKNEEL